MRRLLFAAASIGLTSVWACSSSQSANPDGGIPPLSDASEVDGGGRARCDLPRGGKVRQCAADELCSRQDGSCQKVCRDHCGVVRVPTFMPDSPAQEVDCGGCPNGLACQADNRCRSAPSPCSGLSVAGYCCTAEFGFSEQPLLPEQSAGRVQAMGGYLLAGTQKAGDPEGSIRYALYRYGPRGESLSLLADLGIKELSRSTADKEGFRGYGLAPGGELLDLQLELRTDRLSEQDRDYVLAFKKILSAGALSTAREYRMRRSVLSGPTGSSVGFSHPSFAYGHPVLEGESLQAFGLDDVEMKLDGTSGGENFLGPGTSGRQRGTENEFAWCSFVEAAGQTGTVLCVKPFRIAYRDALGDRKGDLRAPDGATAGIDVGLVGRWVASTRSTDATTFAPNELIVVDSSSTKSIPHFVADPVTVLFSLPANEGPLRLAGHLAPGLPFGFHQRAVGENFEIIPFVIELGAQPRIREFKAIVSKQATLPSPGDTPWLEVDTENDVAFYSATLGTRGSFALPHCAAITP